MPGRYIDVVVEEQEGIPEGCELRFHAVGDARPVKRIHYEPLTGPEGEFEVTAASGAPALAAPVDDSGAGTSILIYGDARGLRLRRVGADAGEPIAEPYLLLADDAIVA
ncbi:MAG TPA: hypothetical protein VH853_12165 [Polyangia bacterium]|jgi:hypothetical protein|nr:hypothetical protein [Polyangia bacterium]